MCCREVLLWFFILKVYWCCTPDVVVWERSRAEKGAMYKIFYIDMLTLYGRCSQLNVDIMPTKKGNSRVAVFIYFSVWHVLCCWRKKYFFRENYRSFRFICISIKPVQILEIERYLRVKLHDSLVIRVCALFTFYC